MKISILVVMAGELGRDWSLPPLPAGATMFESLPFVALVLDALAPAVDTGVITVSDDDHQGVIVIRDGAMSESVWVADGTRSTGVEALALIRAAESTTVSACRLSDEAMGLVGPLIRGEPCYADLRLEWVVWPQLLNDLRERRGIFVVELTTPAGRGVTIVELGRQIATFTESHPTLGGSDLADDLAAGGIGTIRVLVDPAGSDLAAGGVGTIRVLADLAPGMGTQLASSAVAAPLVPAPTIADAQRELGAEHDTRPLVTEGDNPNATLSALFGPHRDTAFRQPLIKSEWSAQRSTIQVESVLPQLKLLVRNRLQRSSASVEEVVEGAAHDRQSVEWLADRVRAMTVRGFMPSTFDQLADDMLALTRGEPG